MMTTSTDTRTSLCDDRQVQMVQSAIRKNGGFILKSSPCTFTREGQVVRGYKVTWTVYRQQARKATV